MRTTVTKEIAESLKRGTIVYHKTLKQGSKGARVPMRVRVTGKCQTWKRTPSDFRLPVKWGLKQSWAIDRYNAHEWEVNQDRN